MQHKVALKSRQRNYNELLTRMNEIQMSASVARPLPECLT